MPIHTVREWRLTELEKGSDGLQAVPLQLWVTLLEIPSLGRKPASSVITGSCTTLLNPCRSTEPPLRLSNHSCRHKGDHWKPDIDYKQHDAVFVMDVTIPFENENVTPWQEQPWRKSRIMRHSSRLYRNNYSPQEEKSSLWSWAYEVLFQPQQSLPLSKTEKKI